MDTAKLTIIGNNKGFAIVYIALAIFVLVGCLGLAIDLGHMYMVRGELQNAADASALAGAAVLYTDTGGGVLTPNPSGALVPATAFISQNRSDGTPLTDSTVVTGYWDINTSPPSMSLTTPTPRPAVGVTVERSTGKNGGAVPVFFAKVLPGILDTAPVTSRQAVAIRGFPGSVNAPVFPMALSRCMTEAYFSTIPFPTPPTTIITFSTSTPTPYSPGCSPGAWTSLTTDNNDANYVRSLVDNFNSGIASVLHTGDTIYIKPVPVPVAMIYGAVTSPQDVFMPIVGDSASAQAGDQSSWGIQGFAWFHIDHVVGETITGRFLGIMDAPPGSLPGGSLSDALTHPQMVH